MTADKSLAFKITRRSVPLNKGQCAFHDLIFHYVRGDEIIWPIYLDISDHIEKCPLCKKYYSQLCLLLYDDHDNSNQYSKSRRRITIHAGSSIVATKSFEKYYHLIQALKNRGEYSEAFDLCAKCLRKANIQPLIYRFLSHLLYDSGGEITEAQCREVFAKCHSPESMIYYFEGSLLYREGHFRKCIGPLTKAIRLDPRNYYALNNIGIARLMLGQLDKAQTIFYYSLKKFRRIADEKGMAIVAGNIGLSLANETDFIASLKYFKATLRKLGDEYFLPERIRILTNLGDLYLDCYKFKHALKYYHSAAELANRFHCYQPLIKSLQKMGSICQLLGMTDVSEVVLIKALDLADRSNDNYWRAEIYRSLGNLYIIHSDFHKADTYLTKAFEIFRTYVIFTSLSKVYESRAIVQEQTNNNRLSNNYYEKAARIAKSKNQNKNYFRTVAALCFSMIDDNKIGEAFSLIISLITASTEGEYIDIVKKYKELRDASYCFKDMNIIDFIDAALDNLRKDLYGMENGKTKRNYFYKLKYMFVTYFLTKYQYKFADLSMPGGIRDLDGTAETFYFSQYRSIKEILRTLTELIVTKHDIVPFNEQSAKELIIC